MSQNMATAVHPYIEGLLSGTRELPKSAHAWLDARRGAALERANALSVPTTRDEEWRFTDLSSLTRVQLSTAGAPGKVEGAAIESCAVPEAGTRLVFIDGVYAPELSTTTVGTAGAQVLPLSQALHTQSQHLEPHLAKLAAFENNVFAALNTVHLRDGAAVVVPRNAACEKAVHLLFVATQPNTASHPRVVVVAESGCDCTVVEEYIGLTEDAYLTNAVTEISLAPTARLRHIKLQRENARAFHIATCAVDVAKDASYVSQTITLGARLSRFDLNVVLNGEGANAEMDGLALISARQLADSHTVIDHAHPHGRSVQLHKTIVDGAAHAVFSGKIHVRPGAQATDSSQQSRNLLLSDKATVDTKPQLEIFADDVKCAHGATVGQLDAEQLFYLTSRGLAERAARNLLTYAFGAAVIERIPLPSVVKRLERTVMAQTGASA
jgi:Fe-S cluster assembly protein SufD